MAQTVILGVIGSDAHVVGITILEQALQAAGLDVVNLGVQTSQDEFVSAAKSHDAEAVLVSSLYGHAKQDCDGFHRKIAERVFDSETDPEEAIAALRRDLGLTQTDQERATV